MPATSVAMKIEYFHASKYGNGAMVDADAVMTKDVPARATVAGNPAEPV